MENSQFSRIVIDFSFKLKRVISLSIEREMNLTYPQWRVIKTVWCSGDPISSKEIADILCFDKVTISDIVNRLIRKGYLIKEVDKNDRRRNILNLSEKTQWLCKDVIRVEKNFNQSLFAGMSHEQIDQYLTTTDMLIKNLNKMK